MNSRKGNRMSRFPHCPRSANRYPLLVLGLALAACSPKGEALYQRAESSLAKGDIRAAVIDLKNLVESEPQNAMARALLAQALVDSGDVQAGEIELQKAKDLGIAREAILVPDCKVMVAKGEYEKVLSDCQPASATAKDKAALHVAQGRALMGLERPAEAKQEFEAALAAQPESFDALVGLASSTFRVDGKVAAGSVLERAPEPVKQRSRYWMAVGGLAIDAGDFAAAEQSFRTAIEKADKKPQSTERLAALSALAETQMRQGKLEEANATVAELSKAVPDSLMVKQLSAQVAAAGGDLDTARSLLEEVVSKQADNYSARTMLGMLLLQQGNYGQAEMHFQSLVASQPDNIQAQRLLAETRMRVQSPEQTLESLKATLDPATADPAMLALAGQLSLRAGDAEQALSYFAQALALSGPDTPTATQLDIASGFMLAGDMDRAIGILEAMPDSVSGYQREYLLMLALLRNGEKSRALATADAMIARSGEDPAVRNMVAGVYAAAGEGSAGRQQFEEALKLKPNDPDTLLNLARLDLAEGKASDAEQRFRQVLETEPKNLPAMLGVAAAAAARQDAAEAEKWLHNAVREHPGSVEAQLGLAQLYIERRDYEKAGLAVDAATKLAPESGVVANARGLVQIGVNDAAGAKDSFEKAARLSPKSYNYKVNLARAYLLDRDVDGALGVLDQILKEQPQYLPALALAAGVSLQEGKVDQAAGYVKRIEEVAPDSPLSHRLDGDLAMVQQRYPDALKSYRLAGAKGKDSGLVLAEYRAAVFAKSAEPEKILIEWVAAHPEDSTLVAVLALTYEQRGDSERARALYEQSLEGAPGNAMTLNNLAVLYQRRGDPRAVETARKAYAAAPQSAAVQDTYGWILYEKGEIDEALRLLAAAAEGLPENSEVQYHYAATLAKKGDAAGAAAVMKKVRLSQLPDDQRADAEALRDQLAR